MWTLTRRHGHRWPAVLRSLLDGPIYATSWASWHWEPIARANLARELAALDSTA